MNRLTRLGFLGLCGVWVASLSYGQAVGIVRPMTVPDSAWIERQCDSAEQVHVTDDAIAAAVQRADEACEAYRASARDAPARDAWVRAMLAIQDDVGRAAMRAFVPEFGPMLPAGLESYSLFLIPDDRWRGSDFDDERSALWEAFYSFGRSIGDVHAAIWFLDQEDNVDVERGQEYCRRFNLSYNDGPYVVTSNKRPDLLKSEDEIVVIRMGGIAPDRVLTVLNRLSQALRTSGDVATGGLVYEELKQRFLTSFEDYPEGVRAFVSAVFGP